MTLYNNHDQSFGSYIKATTAAGVYEYSYATLSLNSDVADQDQIVVVRKTTLSSSFINAEAPNGLGGSDISADEVLTVWTLPNSSSSGSSMYTINTANKTITMSASASDYVYNRNGTNINLPVFNPGSDELYILRRTYKTNPFITWQTGSRLIASQLNHEVKQLINSIQELVDRDNKLELNPAVGYKNGLVPLNSSGTIDSKYFDATATVNQGLENRSVNTGNGLTGGGNLSADRTLSLLLDGSVGIQVSSDGFSLNLNANHFTTDDSLTLKLNGNSIQSGSSGLSVNLTSSLASTAEDAALTAKGGKDLKDLIDALGSGVRYMGTVQIGGTIPAATYQAGDTFDVIADGATTSGTITDSNGTSQSVDAGDDVRYNNSSVWYVIPETTTLDLTSYLRVDGNSTVTANIPFSSNKITGLAEPTASADAATKNYVDTSTTRTLNLLSDVSISTPSNKDLLIYNSTTSDFENSTLGVTDLNDVTVTSPVEGQLLTYSGGTWVNSGNTGNPQVYSFTGTGSQTAFTFSPVVTSTQVNTFIVSIDGLIQRPTTDFVITDSSTLTFNAAPPSNAVILVINFGINRLVDTLGDNSVTTNAINNNAVTLDKLEDASKNSLITYDGSSNPIRITTTDENKLPVVNSSGTLEYGYSPTGYVGYKITDYPKRTNQTGLTNRNEDLPFRSMIAKFNDGLWKFWGEDIIQHQVESLTDQTTSRTNAFHLFTKKSHELRSLPLIDNQPIFYIRRKQSTLTNKTSSYGTVQDIYTTVNSIFMVNTDGKLFFSSPESFATVAQRYLENSVNIDLKEGYSGFLNVSESSSVIDSVSISDIRTSTPAFQNDGTTTTLSEYSGLMFSNPGVENVVVKDTGGNLYSWGVNDSGQLGTGNTTDQLSDFIQTWNASVSGQAVDFAISVSLNDFQNNRVTSYGVGMVLNSNEELYVTGNKCLGLGSGTLTTTSYQKIPDASWTGLTSPLVKQFALYKHQNMIHADETAYIIDPFCFAIVEGTVSTETKRYLYGWGDFGFNDDTPSASVLDPSRFADAYDTSGSLQSDVLDNVQKVWIVSNGVYSKVYFTNRESGRDLLYGLGSNAYPTLGSSNVTEVVTSTPRPIIASSGEQLGSNGFEVIDIISCSTSRNTDIIWIVCKDANDKHFMLSLGYSVGDDDMDDTIRTPQGFGALGYPAVSMGANTTLTPNSDAFDASRNSQRTDTSWTGGFVRIAHDHVNNPINPNSVLVNANKSSFNTSVTSDGADMATLFASPTVVFTTTNDKIYGFGNNAFGVISDINMVTEPDSTIVEKFYQVFGVSYDKYYGVHSYFYPTQIKF